MARSKELLAQADEAARDALEDRPETDPASYRHGWGDALFTMRGWLSTLSTSAAEEESDPFAGAPWYGIPCKACGKPDVVKVRVIKPTWENRIGGIGDVFCGECATPQGEERTDG